jgi:hypothetical protein
MSRSTPREREFVPSDKLVAIFVEGARNALSYLKKVNDAGGRGDRLYDHDDVDLGTENVRRIIADRIVDVLVSVGGRRQAGLLKDDVIARQAFPKELQDEILELLPIEPERGAEFCAQLLVELKAFFADGGKIASGWGYVDLRKDGALAVAVTTPLRPPAAISNVLLKLEAVDL